MPDLESFRAARWLRTFNLVLQAVLFLTFFLGLNYLARHHAADLRFDLTRDRRYSLSPETLAYVQHLPQPVSIYATFTDENDVPTEVRGLLQEYKTVTETSATGKISVTYLDPYQDRRKAEQLGVEQPGLILLVCGDKPRALRVDELYRLKDRKRDAFVGEQALTAALLEVSSPARQRIYFLVGHGELRPDDVDPARGLSALRDELKLRNFAVDTLELTAARGVPDDASLVVAAAPQTRFTRDEQESLRQYLGAKAGRLIFFLAPGMSTANLGLDDLLLDWGVLVDDDLIFDSGPDNVADDSDLIIRSFDEKHPVMQSLIANKLPLRFGAARSVRADPGRTSSTGLMVTTLAACSPTAWGEVSYRGRVAHYDPGVDIRPLPGLDVEGRLGVAVASERVAVRDKLPFSVRSGRLIVFGTGDLVANSRLSVVGNQLVFLSAVNWSVDRDHVLNVAARPIERFQLALSAGELLKLRYALLFALPGAAAFLGLIVYWTRRS